MEEQIRYPEIFKIKNFMVGGLVGYGDVGDGIYLLRKETLDKMLSSIIKKPFIVGHQKITNENIKDVAKGTVISAEYNPESGQYDCEILVEDEDTIKAIKSGNDKVSSAYDVTSFGEGGRYLGIDYDAEILGGEFTHLALVDNPRYPDGKILINNINDKGDNVMFFRLNKLNEEETKEQKINEEDTIDVDGEKVELKELIDAYKNSCKKNEEEESKDNEDEAKEEANEEEEGKDNEEEAKEESKENEDSDDELVAKVTAIVDRILKEKAQEDEEKKDEDEKENTIASCSKSNELRQASKMYESISCGYKTRAEKIAEANKKYSL